MLVTGGGGTALSDHLLARFDNARLVDGAQLANVRGYAKLANNIFRNGE
jgi:plasmid segregation protein ParM